jgi:hypothetical protein
VSTTIKQGENSNKQNAKDMQPRWCPSGLSYKKRRLQSLRKREAMEKQIEEKPAKSTRTRKVWRPKQMSLLTPKIGTGKRLTCEPNLAEEHHSAEGFPQSIR